MVKVVCLCGVLKVFVRSFLMIGLVFVIYGCFVDEFKVVFEYVMGL